MRHKNKSSGILEISHRSAWGVVSDSLSWCAFIILVHIPCWLISEVSLATLGLTPTPNIAST